MPTTTTNRAAFVQEEYRYVTATSPTVLARNLPGTKTVQVDTNLDEATATALAGKYLADNTSPRTIEVVLDGVMYLDKLIGQVPTFVVNAPAYYTDGRACKVIGFTTDFEANTTTLQVRG